MSRIRLAKIATPAAPPTSSIELFYSNPLSALATIDEFGNVVSLTSASMYRLIRIFWILASTTYTPTTGARALYVEAVGGGGAGAGTSATTANATAGGGGGSGGYSASFLTSPAASYTVTIGAGGVGATGAAGTAGGATSVGTAVIANGGGQAATAPAPGTASAVGGGGAGATTTGAAGDITIPGSAGNRGVVVSTSLVSWGGGGLPPIFGVSASSSMFWATGNSGLAGGAGGGFGAGGTGAMATGTFGALSGGNGAPGAVRVWEWA